jgi:hypothetical protein
MVSGGKLEDTNKHGWETKKIQKAKFKSQKYKLKLKSKAKKTFNFCPPAGGSNLHGKYNSVGADPCVRPSKGPYLPYLKPLIGSTHGSTPTNSLAFCHLRFEFFIAHYAI